MATPTQQFTSTTDEFRQAELAGGALAGGGEMGRRVRTLDWAATPLGPINGWPQSLRSAVSIMLNSRYPIAIYWGPALALLYNDAWSPIPGSKHPWALGQGARAVWPEIWDDIEPLFQQVMSNGEGTWSEDQLLPMHRHGYTEECYFNFTFSPIRGEDGKVGGVFNAVVETTARVIGERRTRLLRTFAERTSGAKSVEEIGELATSLLHDASTDIPFALFYRIAQDGDAMLAAHTGVQATHAACEHRIALSGDTAATSRWPLAESARSLRPTVVDDVEERVGRIAGDRWPEPVRRALVLPVLRAGQERPSGYLVAGISPRLELDDDYRGFLSMLAAQFATAISNARAFEEERERAKALAELDRAKTTFFSNVSHELRTPLTLMLGPTEELIRNDDGNLSMTQAGQLAMLHRNELRLLTLVNTLLEFSRLEAGRVEACFEPTDLVSYTAEIASGFRSAFEHAQLTLNVDTDVRSGVIPRVYVDREMWQRIVLNLLSNAFKHTFEGGVSVVLRKADEKHVELIVRDTGTGIPAEQVPKLFERFHRVPQARSRTHEGTGIGLALVQELVRLHGGSVSVASEVDIGSTFTVRIPLGTAHLPKERVRASAHGISATGNGYAVAEAIRWTDEVTTSSPGTTSGQGSASGTDRARVLVVDDNADMREYVSRMLSARGWSVTTATDGRAALDLLHASDAEPSFDLVLSDVMMPRVDGIELVRELRRDVRTNMLPIILLSARAGEESRVEGLDVGADDFLVKPFSARELVARVGTHVGLGRLRREAVRQLESAAAAREALLVAERSARVEAERARARTEKLRRLSTELAGARTPAEVADVTINACVGGAISTRAVVLRLVEDGKYFSLLGARGYNDDDLANYEFFPTTTDLPVSDAVTSRQPVVIDDTASAATSERYEYMRQWGERTGVRASIVFPLLAGSADDEHALGTLAFEFDEPFTPSDDDLAFFDAIARVSAQAMDRAFAYEKERGLRFEADAARLRAEDANRIKGDFLAAMSHELRTPLNAIAGHTQLIELGVHGDVTPAQLDALSRIQRGQEHLLALINDVLNYAKLEAGRVEFRIEPINVREAVQKVLSMMEPQITGKGIAIDTAVPDELFMRGDAEKVAQVLLNLLSNALKFTDAGGRITIDAQASGDRINVRVVDTGCGIAADKFDAIFEPFVQVNRTLSRNTVGTGLGLSISRDLARGMGGDLSVDSVVDAGSTFTLTLPASSSGPR